MCREQRICAKVELAFVDVRRHYEIIDPPTDG